MIAVGYGMDGIASVDKNDDGDGDGDGDDWAQQVAQEGWSDS